MASPLHVIAEQGAGRLAIVDHPRADPWPPERLGELADVGVSTLVSALTTEEQTLLGHDDTVRAAAEVGMDFVAFPSADGGVARDEAGKVILLSGRLAANVRASRCVAIQCFGGVGRSTLLACSTLVLLGLAPSESLRRVTGGAAASVPRDWLHTVTPHCTVPLPP
jgi:protein-tyrosine phosphatase